MKLDCLLCLALITFDGKEWLKAKEYFNEAYFVAQICNENYIAEKCLCNAGIASGNIIMDKT
jgi:hypothetical protein